MIYTLKQLAKKTPLGSIWQSIQEKRHQQYVKRISSKEPVYPLYCISCNCYFKEFTPLSPYFDEMFAKHGFPYRIYHTETLNWKQYMCPGCHINDRDRLYALYMQKNIDSTRQYNLVEFAPSPQLSAIIRRFANIRHRTADLFMEGVDDKADLLDLHLYNDNSFDVFICSHILEHVDDDVKAMRELYRILKPGGFGIAMVPLFNGVVKTVEDPSEKNEAERWRRFGQDDHVRLYARHEYIQRLESVGFNVNQLDKHYFGEDVLKKNGISDSSILYVVEK